MKRLFDGIMIVTALVAMQAAAEKVSPADTDADGKLSFDEYFAGQTKVFERTGRTLTPEKAKSMFEKKDLNGDGFLTADEILPLKG